MTHSRAEGHGVEQEMRKSIRRMENTEPRVRKASFSNTSYVMSRNKSTIGIFGWDSSSLGGTVTALQDVAQRPLQTMPTAYLTWAPTEMTYALPQVP